MNEIKVEVKAEFHRATDILMHEPGDEVYFGLLHATSALFERPFDRYAAIREHQCYQHTLQAKRVRVHLAKNLLLDDAVDKFGNRVSSTALDQLAGVVKQSLVYMTPGLDQDKDATIKKIHPDDLVRIVLEKPTVHFTVDQRGRTISDYYAFQPLCNLYFMRDQMIVTDKGVVLGRMSQDMRTREVEIARTLLERLRITPIYQVSNGCLEGGDFMPAGDFAMIGVGYRTDRVAVDELLQHPEVWGYDEIAVVKDPQPRETQMHLDTYFNIVGRNLALIVQSRRNDPSDKPTVDTYKRTPTGGYTADRQNVDFVTYVENEKGFNLVEILEEEQQRYGVNVLCVDDREIIGSQDVSDVYEQKFIDRSITYTLLDFSNIRLGYGSNHCMTQVLHRTA